VPVTPQAVESELSEQPTPLVANGTRRMSAGSAAP
jgi:hypothetical protein